MGIRPRVLVAALALVVIGLPASAWAQRIDVEATTTKGVSFKGLHTYKWLPPPPAIPATIAPGSVPSPRRTIAEVDPVVHDLIDRALQAKGYRLVESGESDLLVGYLVNMSSDANTFSMADEYSAVTGVTIYFGPSSTSRTTSLTYADLGTLAVGIAASGTKQVLWRGVAKTKITLDTPHAKVDEHIEEGVQKMFRKFPKQSDK